MTYEKDLVRIKTAGAEARIAAMGPEPRIAVTVDAPIGEALRKRADGEDWTIMHPKHLELLPKKPDSPNGEYGIKVLDLDAVRRKAKGGNLAARMIVDKFTALIEELADARQQAPKGFIP